MASTAYHDIVDLLDGQLTLPEDDFDTAKAKMDALHGLPLMADTFHEWRELNGVRCATVIAAGTTAGLDRHPDDRVLLYFRGGAFIAADGDGFLFYAEFLSRLINCPVVMVDYSLLPKEQFPVALHECCDAYQGLLGLGINPQHIGLIGDSCGGGLVLSSLLKLRESNCELPACGISLCGWFDLARQNGSDRVGSNHNNINDIDPLYNQSYCHQRGLEYAGANQLQNPLVSPLYGDFSGLPALLLQAGEIDPTSWQAKHVADIASQQNVTVEINIFPEMIHGFHGFGSQGVPESLKAIAKVKTFFYQAIS